MPVTIGTLTSNVNVVDSSGGVLNDETIEQIVRIVLARMKEEMASQEQSRQEREIRNRMSESEPS